MPDRRSLPWPLTALVLGLALCACSTAEGPAPDEKTVLLEAEFFQERWSDGGATLLIKSVDGQFAWQNRMMLTAGRASSGSKSRRAGVAAQTTTASRRNTPTKSPDLFMCIRVREKAPQ